MAADPRVGDVVSCYTRIVRTGTTSVTVEIKAVAMRQDSGRLVPVTEGIFVYVALDEDGQPAPMEPTG